MSPLTVLKTLYVSCKSNQYTLLKNLKSVDNEIEKIFLYKVKQSRIDKKSSYIRISIYYVVHFIQFLHSAVIFIARFIERDGKSANLHVT